MKMISCVPTSTIIILTTSHDQFIVYVMIVDVGKDSSFYSVMVNFHYPLVN
jgi:hypothetical protein